METSLLERSFFIKSPIIIHRSCYIHSMVMGSSSFHLSTPHQHVFLHHPSLILHLSLVAHTNGSTATLNSWSELSLHPTLPILAIDHPTTSCFLTHRSPPPWQPSILSSPIIPLSPHQVYKTINSKSSTLARPRSLILLDSKKMVMKRE